MNQIYRHLSVSLLTFGGLLAACSEKPDSSAEMSSSAPEANSNIVITAPNESETSATFGRNFRTESVLSGFNSEDDGSGNQVFIDNGISPEQAKAFTSSITSNLEPDEQVLVAYPADALMVPGNLTFIEFQWEVLNSQDQFMVKATAGELVYHFHLQVECTGQRFCTKELPQAEWLQLGRDHAGETLKFEVFASDGQTVSVSEALNIRFSPEPLFGALYYWASTSETIKRVSFGSERAVDFIIPGENVDYECVACHSVSRDGSTIAFAVGPDEGENVTGIQVTSTLDPTMTKIVPQKGQSPYPKRHVHLDSWDGQGPTDQFGNNVALNPNGSLMAVNGTRINENGDLWPIFLEIRDTNSGAVKGVVNTNDGASNLFGGESMGIHPEWSPNGEQLAITHAVNGSEGLSAWRSNQSGISLLDINADGSLGQVTPLVNESEDGSYHFYPTWSPDGRYVAFVTSWDVNRVGEEALGSVGNLNGVLRMVEVAQAPVTCPGPACIELTAGTGYGVEDAKNLSAADGSTWPKFAPFAQADNSVYFITYTARRTYGLYPNRSSQLWMFGIDTTKGPDPSFSSFWLPYQEVTDGSLSPYWTETLPCTADTENDTCTGCFGAEICKINADNTSCVCEAPAIPR